MWDMPWKLYDEIVVITIAMQQQHRRSPFCCNAAINLMIYEREREKKKKRQSSRSNATLSVCCYFARDTICRFIIFHLLNWFSFGPKWQTEPRRIMNIWSRASTAILAIAPALNHILCFALDSFFHSLHCIALHCIHLKCLMMMMSIQNITDFASSLAPATSMINYLLWFFAFHIISVQCDAASFFHLLNY